MLTESSEDASENQNVPSQKIPAVPTQKIPAVSSQKIPAVSSQKIPTVSTQKISVVSTQKIPAISSQNISSVEIPLFTGHMQAWQEDCSSCVEEEICCPPSALQKRHLSLEEKKKQYFFLILKRLLQELLTLTTGMWDEDMHEGSTYRLVYQSKTCEMHILDAKGHVHWHDKIATINVYLKWGEGLNEPLSLEDLQRVHNELRFLGFEKDKVDACFSLARNEFVKETWSVQKHCTLQIICDEVNRTFVSGRRDYAITVLYNDTKDTAAYYFPKWVNKEWVVECRYG